MTGVVWKTSVYDSQPASFALVGEGFGQSPFTIREVRDNGDSAKVIPYLIAAGHFSVKGINLLSGEVTDFARVDDGERILSTFVERFVSVEVDANNLYFLKEYQGEASLVVKSFFEGKVKQIPVDEPLVAGPVKVGDRICLYSRNSLYVLKEDELRSYPISGGFSAWVSPTEVVGLHPHFGRMPAVVRGESIYIPGSKGDTRGFLFVGFQNGSVNLAFLPCDGDVSYTQDSEGRLILARSGEIIVYEHTTPRTVRKDEQLTPTEIPYLSKSLTVGSTTSPGGAYSLRFYQDNGARDYSLSTLRGFVEVAGYVSMSNAFGVMHVDDNAYLGITVWDA